ncbi:hypothetical protein GCM10007907_30280 [Chitinimonas prasina]|uniref:Class I SAM-dependent methyltransferase n=1 Tax=Chitinimonas prasina TaxID=1434937 RepID=A0ABQ5YJU9_9NEIS|nr:hypothetical protein [Chitinimonas prasina]GLR14238.1 hypothetical protein GCM10007907_30280 [Chitinimonas prasina]
MDILPGLAARQYELVMAIDILEHFDMPTGERFLAELKRVASGHVLVSTPKSFIHQEVEANPLENHRSLWTADDLARNGFTHLIPDAESWIAVCNI